MGHEYKSVAVGGVSEVKDEGDGVITAFVSVTGVEDNVKDIIEPGAYVDTLKKRTPKGVWGHSWVTPTSKTLAAKELPPGSPELPKELSNGDPWPKEAGALKIKMQFNLGTPRGRDAYSDVKFFGPQQEWSIGYSVPPGASYKDDNGVRHIKKLDLFEYSAVLFGAMTHARTESVADAQLGQKLLSGISALEVKSLEDAVMLYRKENTIAEPEVTEDFVGDETEESDADEEIEEEVDDDDLDDDDLDDDPDEDDDEEKAMRALMDLSVKDLRAFYDVVGKVLDALGGVDDGIDYLTMGTKALIEAKATGFDSIADAVAAIDVQLDTVDAKVLRDSADALDAAIVANDEQGAHEAASYLFDTLEKVMDTTDDGDLSLKAVARTVADKSKTDDEEDLEDDPEYGGDNGDDEDEEDDWEESDDDQPDKKKKQFAYVSEKGIEHKSVPFAGREFGMPRGAEDLDTKERVQAYIANLPNDALLAMDVVLDETRGNGGLKSYVSDEIENRIYTGDLSTEEKMAVTRSAMGQQGRGGGRHVQASTGKTPGPGKNFGETGAAAKPSAKRLKKAVKGIKKPGTGKRVVKVASGASKPVSRMAGGDQTQYKGEISDEVRAKLAKSGKAMEDGSYPITNVAQLKKAIQSCGRAKDQDAAKMHIKKRAKELGMSNLIPGEWKTEQIDTTELKSLESFVLDVT